MTLASISALRNSNFLEKDDTIKYAIRLRLLLLLLLLLLFFAQIVILNGICADICIENLCGTYNIFIYLTFDIKCLNFSYLSIPFG